MSADEKIKILSRLNELLERDASWSMDYCLGVNRAIEVVRNFGADNGSVDSLNQQKS